MFKLLLTKQAENDLESSYNWYYERDKKVAEKFLDEVNLAFELIQEEPFNFLITFKDYRILRLKRFPFKIIFRVKNNLIIIKAIFHNKRKPMTWEN